MNILTPTLIAFALAMDAFAVSVSNGIGTQKPRIWFAFKISILFGAFQAMMPLAGSAVGADVARLVFKVSGWVAFSILVLVGLRMIHESVTAQEKRLDPYKIGLLLFYALATSIDAFSVGFSLSLVGKPVLLVAVMAGIVTFFMSFTGVFIGSNIGRNSGRNMGILGGIILIAIGIKALSGH
ncbi:MAG: hypothetical protein DRG37_06360 [Deltaproteobacteria bacterium]|nr:MAG: hypothetical protein DRG37_06360 [Deltaproteobacteria bacterium]